jgi:hypothetical protein
MSLHVEVILRVTNPQGTPLTASQARTMVVSNTPANTDVPDEQIAEDYQTAAVKLTEMIDRAHADITEQLERRIEAHR